jgi:hypothetical protein
VSAQLATITLIVLGLWLLQLVPAARALLVTCIVGIATCYRTINGSGLWQHTSSALWLVLGLATWTKAPARPSLYPLAGAALALATACRPILVPAALLVVVDAARRRGLRQALPTGFVVAGIGGAALYANWYLHGSLLGGRAEIVEHAARTHQVTSYFQFSLLHYLGLLFAPSRGLFVYSPVLLFALPGLVRLLTASAPPPLRDITIAGLLVFGLYGFVATWWGGWVYGPRYMADLLPFFALWLALTPPLVTRAARVVFVATLAWSIAVPQLGAMTHPCGWNRTPRSVDQDPSRLWSLRDTEISRCLAVLTQRSASRNPPPAGRRRPGALQPATRHAAGSPP